jgi:signal peptidase I
MGGRGRREINDVDRNNRRRIIRLHDKRYYYIGFLILITIVCVCGCDPVDLLRLRFKIYKFPAKSMIPTLLPGERILVDLLHYKDHNPQRGDIVVF